MVREPTHEPLDLDVLWDLGDAIEDKCPDGVLSVKSLEEIASEQGVPLAYVYVAAASDPDLHWEEKSPAQVTVCAGSCQAYGACELIEQILAKRAEGTVPFDLRTVGCLDRCEQAIAVDLHTPQGSWGQINLTPADADAIIKAL